MSRRQFIEGLFRIWQNFEPNSENFDEIGHILIFVKGTILQR